MVELAAPSDPLEGWGEGRHRRVELVKKGERDEGASEAERVPPGLDERRRAQMLRQQLLVAVNDLHKA